MDPVAIVGIGHTDQRAEFPGRNFAELVYEAVVRALEDAGVDIDFVDNVVTTSNDFWDGRTISCMATGDASGVARDKNTSCVEGDGTMGAFYGLTRILSGAYGTTLVTAHAKASESVEGLITNAAFDPIYERALGIDRTAASALQAAAYTERHGVSEMDCAEVVVKNRGNGQDNPFVHGGAGLTVEEVLQSALIARPIKELDCSPPSDGACAILLARGEVARRLQVEPIWVRGVAYCTDSYMLGERDLAACPSLVDAAERAYAMAGIEDPGQEIGLVELSEMFSYQELLWSEGLGLCEPGRGRELLLNGESARSGRIPINPSGGCLSGRTEVAAGLQRMIECVRQLRGAGGEMQVGQEVGTAVAHGTNGICGQTHCVWVLGQEA